MRKVCVAEADSIRPGTEAQWFLVMCERSTSPAWVAVIASNASQTSLGITL